METRHYNQITQEAWDAAAEDYKKRYRIPESISEEQARAQFAKIARSALFAVTFRYANHHRSLKKLGPLPQTPMPRWLTQWIEDRITALDEELKCPGARHYQAMVNGLLPQLQAAEHYFLGHGK